MSPLDFKRRYVTHILSDARLVTDPELRELSVELCEFAVYHPLLLLAYKVDLDSTLFLSEAGLPLSAAPFMNFKAYTKEEIDGLYSSQLAPSTIFPIGQNNYGDFIGIEVASAAVVYSMHDGTRERVFINSSISRLAETLCWYQELRAQRRLQDLPAKLSAYDKSALEPGAMWTAEGHNEA